MERQLAMDHKNDSNEVAREFFIQTLSVLKLNLCVK
jgi:hypothetical protein